MRNVAWFASLIAVITLLLVSAISTVGTASTPTSYALTVDVQVSTPTGVQTPNWLNFTLENAATGQSCREPTNGGAVFFNSTNCPALTAGWWHVSMVPQVLTLSQGNAIYVTPSNATPLNVYLGQANGAATYVNFGGLTVTPASSTLKGVIEGVSGGATYHLSLINPSFPGAPIATTTANAPQSGSPNLLPRIHVETPYTASPAATLYTVTIVTFPAACTVTFNGGTFSSGSTTTVPAGTYQIAAQACTNAAFANWTSTVGPVANPFASSTNVTVSSNGGLFANYTSTASYSFNNVPSGTWTLYTYGLAANTLSNFPRYNYTQAIIPKGGTKTLDVNLTTGYLLWGNYRSTNTLTFSAPSNISIYDVTSHQIYTTYLPNTGTTYYQAGLYSSNLGSQPGAENFVAFLNPRGYTSVFSNVSVSAASPTVNFNPSVSLSNGSRYYTNISFGSNFSNVAVATNAWLSPHGSVVQLPNASIGNLWGQIGLDFNNSVPEVSAGAYSSFYNWLVSSGPVYPAQANGLAVNGTVFKENGAYTNTLPNHLPGFNRQAFWSSQPISYTTSHSYALNASLGNNFSSYQLSVGFEYPQAGQYNSYRVMLPQGYVLENGSAAPPNTVLRPSGPVGPGGDLWTSFTILPSPYSKSSGVANFTVYKIGNVSAILNVTSSNFAFSTKNILNSTLNNYTVVLGANQNSSFSASHSLLPPTMNVTSYVFNFGTGASCVNYTGSASSISAGCVVGNTSTPTIHHIFKAGGLYNGTLTLRTSGNVTNSSTFFVYVGDQAPTPHISANVTNEAMVNATVGYAYANWSSNLHFNATGSSDFLWASGPKGNISISNWTILSGTTHSYTNLTVGSGAKVFGNVSYQFLGTSSYSKGTFTIPGTSTKVKLVGWAYSVTLTLWNTAGFRANATLWILANDTQAPVAVATVQDAAGHNVTGGLVEGTNHTVEVQLLDNYSYEPHANGTLSQFSWAVRNSASMFENFSNCRLTVNKTCYWNSSTDNKWILYLPASTGTYNWTLNVTDLAGNTGNATYPLTVAQNLTFRPILTVANLTASSTTMTDGSSYSITVNVNNTAFKKAIAYNVSALFYLTNAAGTGKTTIASPSKVQWYGYVGGVLNDSSSYTGVLPAQKANQTWEAKITYSPPSGTTGSYLVWVNVTASNEFAGEYASKANVASISVTINPNPLTQDLEYVAIAVAAIVIIVVVVFYWRRRTMGPTTSSKKDRKGGKEEKASKDDKSKASESSDKDDDE